MKMRSAIGWTALCVMLGAPAAKSVLSQSNPSPDKLASTATQHFQSQSYNQAIAAARKYLDANPDGPKANQMRRIIGVGFSGLGQHKEAIQSLLDLVGRSALFKEDARVMDALAHSAAATRHPNAVDWMNQAIAVHAEQTDAARQTELLFDLAKYQISNIYNLLPKHASKPWQERLLYGVIEVLKTYDRAFAAAPKQFNQVRALQSKADLVRRYGHSLKNYPREKWPPGIQSDEDLGQPYLTAIKFEREIVRRFPDSSHEAAALFRIGLTHEQQRQDYVAAVKTFREVVKRFPNIGEGKQAEKHIEQILAPQLHIHVNGVVLPGKQPEYVWSARNLKEIAMRAYAVDLFDLVRKVKNFQNLHNYSVAGQTPVKTWTVQTGDTGNHHQTSNGKDAIKAPVSDANAYLVIAEGTTPQGKSTEQRTIMIVSRLTLVSKATVDKALYFAVDAITGKPIEGSELLWTRTMRRNSTTYYEHEELTIPDSGLGQVEYVQNQQGQMFVARHGNHYATTIDYRYWSRSTNQTYAYVYTDRPVYRPEQQVGFKIVVREYVNGTYQMPSDGNVAVTITDPRGQKVYEQTLQANEFGTVSGGFELTSTPKLGQYRFHVSMAKRSIRMGPGHVFRVEEYKKPEFKVAVTADKPTYKMGGKISATIHGEYYFGGPVPDAEVEYTVYRSTYRYSPIIVRPFDWFYADYARESRRWWWYPRLPTRQDVVARGKLTTDKEGDAVLEVQSEPFDAIPQADLQYRFEVKMVDQSRRQINASATINVTHTAFYVSLTPKQRMYRPKDRVRIEVKGESPNSQPVAFDGVATVSYVTQREERDSKGNVKTEEDLEEVSRHEISVDKSGAGLLDFVAGKKGLYRIDVETDDPYGGKVTAKTYLWVAQGEGAFAHIANRDVELVLDKTTAKAGESVNVLVNSKYDDAYVLLTCEADDMYFHHVVYLPDHSKTVEIPVTESLQPNVSVKALLVRDNQIFKTEEKLRVPPTEKFLTVTLKTGTERFQPREQAEVEVVVTDHEGKPVQGELSLGVLDASVLYIQSETRGDVRKFFHGRIRPDRVSTLSSYDQPSRYLYEREVRLGVRARFARGGAVAMEGLSVSAPMAASAPAEDAEVAKKAEKQQELVQPEIRSEFPDTVYWAAHLTTGEDGKATATIRFPDSLTTWQLTAISLTKDTRVGEVRHEVQTKKNILVRLQSPRFFVERDAVTLSAIAHNYLEEPKTIRVGVEVSEHLSFADDGETAISERYKEVVVEPGGEERVDFLAHVLKPGEAIVTAKALTTEESDAMQLTLPAYEFGAEKLLVQSGVLFEGTTNREQFTLEIPQQIREGSQSLHLQVSPTVAGVMLQSLPYLLGYPYGCVEQTMSRFLPAVLTARTLKELGLNLADVKNIPAYDEAVQRRLKTLSRSPVFDEQEMEKIIAAGLNRLADFQHADGGWGWWKNDQSNPYMTAYVVSGLAAARDAKVTLPSNMLERATRWLANSVVRPDPVTRYNWQAEEDKSVRTYMLYAIGLSDGRLLQQPDVRNQLREIFAGRDRLNDYSRALLALALHHAKLGEEADITVANIKDRAQLDEGNASWGKYRSYWYWYHAGTEATSFSLKALLAIAPDDDMIPKAVNWLLRHRQGTRWFNTKDTAIVCYALADYLKQTNELDPDMTIVMQVRDQTKKVKVTRENLFTLDNELSLTGEQLGRGVQKLIVQRQGRGNLYFTAWAKFFTKEDKIAPAGNEVYVTRDYYLLKPRQVEETRIVVDPKTGQRKEQKVNAIVQERQPITEGQKLSSGDLIEVALTIEAKNNFEYMMIEDPKPAGCEPTELKSGHTWGGGVGSHREFRDEKVAFFATYLNKGKHRLTYQLRAEIPGVFHALPSHAESMYAPLVRANAASDVLVLVDKE